MRFFEINAAGIFHRCCVTTAYKPAARHPQRGLAQHGHTRYYWTSARLYLGLVQALNTFYGYFFAFDLPQGIRLAEDLAL